MSIDDPKAYVSGDYQSDLLGSIHPANRVSTVKFPQIRVVDRSTERLNFHTNIVTIDIAQIIEIRSPAFQQSEFGEGRGCLSADTLASHTKAVASSSAIAGLADELTIGLGFAAGTSPDTPGFPFIGDTDVLLGK